MVIPHSLLIEDEVIEFHSLGTHFNCKQTKTTTMKERNKQKIQNKTQQKNPKTF